MELAAKWQNTADSYGVSGKVLVTMQDAIEDLGDHHAPTAEHSMRVGIMSGKIAEHLGVDPKPSFYGGTLHDYGKLNVASELLSKTTTWTEADARALRNHPMDGYEKIMEAGLFVTAGIVVRHHTFQPNAYPEHPPELPAELPAYLGSFVIQNARLVALADYYDAAHRNDTGANLNGEEIRAKVLAHNPDQVSLIDELYEARVFDSAEPASQAN